ncbi:MAG: RNA polymerase sigma factor [Melioribacteraceae bacterium]|nr:RNA polymerase sigma factor [Melioribacteraceae bacterium]
MEFSDKELIEQFISGSDYAFNLLAKKYQPKIYWHARRMLGNHDDADELMQEVLLVIYNKLNSFRFDSNLSTWIYKITSTRAINFIKRKNVKRFLRISDSKELLDGQNLHAAKDIIKNIEDKEKIDLINHQLQKLPVKQREVFILRNFEGLSYDEINKITGQSVGALKANYFHALKKITGLIDEQ